MCEDQQSSSLLKLTAVNENQLTQLDVQWKQRLHGCWLSEDPIPSAGEEENFALLQGHLVSVLYQNLPKVARGLDITVFRT